MVARQCSLALLSLLRSHSHDDLDTPSQTFVHNNTHQTHNHIYDGNLKTHHQGMIPSSAHDLVCLEHHQDHHNSKELRGHGPHMTHDTPSMPSSARHERDSTLLSSTSTLYPRTMSHRPSQLYNAIKGALSSFADTSMSSAWWFFFLLERYSILSDSPQRVDRFFPILPPSSTHSLRACILCWCSWILPCLVLWTLLGMLQVSLSLSLSLSLPLCLASPLCLYLFWSIFPQSSLCLFSLNFLYALHSFCLLIFVLARSGVHTKEGSTLFYHLIRINPLYLSYVLSRSQDFDILVTYIHTYIQRQRQKQRQRDEKVQHTDRIWETVRETKTERGQFQLKLFYYYYFFIITHF
jgi:hypothetical protein